MEDRRKKRAASAHLMVAAAAAARREEEEEEEEEEEKEKKTKKRRNKKEQTPPAPTSALERGRMWLSAKDTERLEHAAEQEREQNEDHPQEGVKLLQPTEAVTDKHLHDVGTTLAADFDPFTFKLCYATIPTNQRLHGAGGASRGQLEQWTRLATAHKKKLTPQITMEQALNLGLVDEDMNEASQITVEPECFVPLLWFAQELAALPLAEDFKEMQFADVRTFAYNTDTEGVNNVWRKCISIVYRLKQDLFDYAFRIRALTSAASSTAH
jgi:ATPase subunit of ABC transporter with duplicated ATPase domains